MKRILAAVVAAMMLLCAMPVGVGAVANAPDIYVNYMTEDGNIVSRHAYYNEHVSADGTISIKDGVVTLNNADITLFEISPYSRAANLLMALAEEEADESLPAVTVVVKGENTLGNVYIDSADVVFTGDGTLDVKIDQEMYEDGYYDEQYHNGGNYTNFVVNCASVTIDGPTININNKPATPDEDNEDTAGMVLLALKNADHTFTPSALTLENGALNIITNDAEEGSSGIKVDYLTPQTRLLSLRASDEEPSMPVHANITINGGKLDVKAGKSDYGSSVAINAAYANLIINGGEVNAVAGDAANISAGISIGASVLAASEEEEVPSYGEFVVDGGNVTAIAGMAGAISAGVFAMQAGVSLVDGYLEAVGGQISESLMPVYYDDSSVSPEDFLMTSAGLIVFMGQFDCSNAIELILQGQGRAMSILPFSFSIAEDAYGKYAADYNATVLREFDEGYFKTWNELFDITTLDVNNLMNELSKYQYIHLNEPKDDDPAGFNLFMLMLMMAQIDTDITGEGTVTHDGNTRMAYFHKPRTYTITPAEGWEIADVLYEGESLGAVDTVEIIPTVRKSQLEVIFTEIASDDAE